MNYNEKEKHIIALAAGHGYDLHAMSNGKSWVAKPATGNNKRLGTVIFTDFKQAEEYFNRMK